MDDDEPVLHPWIRDVFIDMLTDPEALELHDVAKMLAEVKLTRGADHATMMAEVTAWLDQKAKDDPGLPIRLAQAFSDARARRQRLEELED